MKTKSIFMCFTLFLTGSTLFAQTDWLEKFADQKDITQVTVTKALLKMVPTITASYDMNGLDIKEIVAKLDQIDIFSSSKEETAKLMRKEAAAFLKNNKSFEALLIIRDNPDNVTFYAQHEGGYIKSLLMFADDGEECTIIRLLGKFTTKDIQKITEKM